jgi:hypothetical protein
MAIKGLNDYLLEELASNNYFIELARQFNTPIPESIRNPVSHAIKTINDELKERRRIDELNRNFKSSRDATLTHLDLIDQNKDREKERQIEVQVEAHRRFEAEQQHRKQRPTQEAQPKAEAVGDYGVGKGRRDNQIDFILKTAKNLNFDLLKIPEGGKAKIKTECLRNTGLFTDSGFNHAWKEANKLKVISMQDKEKYL